MYDLSSDRLEKLNIPPDIVHRNYTKVIDKSNVAKAAAPRLNTSSFDQPPHTLFVGFPAILNAGPKFESID
jgi:hypothetical protein